VLTFWAGQIKKGKDRELSCPKEWICSGYGVSILMVKAKRCKKIRSGRQGKDVFGESSGTGCEPGGTAARD
jgi:hypothetical protein